MSNILKKYAKNLFWIVIFALFAFYFISKGNFNEIMLTLKQASKFWMFVVCIIALLPVILDGYIYKLFVDIYQKGYTLKQGIVNAFAGAFFCGITPFASGGQFAQIYVFSKQKVGTSNAIGILLIHFILYQSTLVLFTLLILLFKFQYFYHEYSTYVSFALIGFAVNSVVICNLFLCAFSHKMQDFLICKVLYLASKVHIIKNYEKAKDDWQVKIADFREGLKVLSHHKSVLIKATICFIVRLLMTYSIPFLGALALGKTIPLVEVTNYIGVCAFVYLVSAFIPIPGGSGGAEGAYVLLYSFIMGNILASSSMLLWRFATYYFVIFLGGIIFSFNKEINAIKE